MLSVKEYQTVTSISGPLMMVEMVDEEMIHGVVLQVDNDELVLLW